MESHTAPCRREGREGVPPWRGVAFYFKKVCVAYRRAYRRTIRSRRCPAAAVPAPHCTPVVLPLPYSTFPPPCRRARKVRKVQNGVFGGRHAVVRPPGKVNITFLVVGAPRLGWQLLLLLPLLGAAGGSVYTPRPSAPRSSARARCALPLAVAPAARRGACQTRRPTCCGRPCCSWTAGLWPAGLRACGRGLQLQLSPASDPPRRRRRGGAGGGARPHPGLFSRLDGRDAG